ncbi:MAG TPA: Spy/CpxP family protein refolding chaperone [Pyrinomonadaceae bacterium]|nr:Spy/CpxP family protein refolding chaperone [Pyrinomonadaceae bacterium]
METPLIKRTALAGLMLSALLFATSASQAFAQNPVEPPPAVAEQDDQAQNWRGMLGLTPDQVGRIRSILEGSKMERQAARRRLNQAQRALDQAIYSDDATEAVIDQRAREVAEAQATEVRLRATTELSIRRVLTPEQLDTFRRIRQERMRAQAARRLENGGQPRPLKNGGTVDALNQQNQRNVRPPAADGQGERGPGPGLNPRGRRGLLPRRIRP